LFVTSIQIWRPARIFEAYDHYRTKAFGNKKTSSLQQAPLQQCLHVATAIGNQHDINMRTYNPINNTVGLKEPLQNYYACRYGVKNWLNILIYYL